MSTNEIISKSFEVVRYLNNSINELYEEYKKRKVIYYSNVDYYKKFGGLYPTNTFRRVLDKIDELKETKKYILENIDEIKITRRYDLEFKEYIDSLLNLLI